jgi:hypothetical protein
MAVHTAPVESEDVESGHGLMTHQKTYVALLAQLMDARGQQFGVVGTVRRMAGEAILLYRGVLPEQRAPLLRVTLIAKAIGGVGLEHFAAFASVRIMTGDATDFHDLILCAEQMRGALEEIFSLFLVAAEAGLLHGQLGQHPLRRFVVMYAVARHASHVFSVVRSAAPPVTLLSTGVTLKA